MNEQVVNEIKQIIDGGETEIQLQGVCSECGGMLTATMNLDDPNEPRAWILCENCGMEEDADVTPAVINSLSIDKIGKLFILNTAEPIHVI